MKNNKILKIYMSIGILFIFVLVCVFSFDMYLLMSNSTYETINIKEKEQYTLPDDFVSACESSNNTVVKVKTMRGKCTLTGVNKGTTDVGVFLASDGIQNKIYNINVSSSVKINKRFRISMRSLIFSIDTTNMNNVDFRYCMVSNNASCNLEPISTNNTITVQNNSIRFNNLNSGVKKVCLYAYDNNKVIDSLCIDRGLFNLFW